MACVGIPKEVQGFKVARYDEGRRVDLYGDNHVNIIYGECVVNPAGKPYGNGRLVQLDGARDSVFRWESTLDLDSSHYVDLVGFAGDRMFTIHAWQNAGATENEVAVALRVARLAIASARAAEEPHHRLELRYPPGYAPTKAEEERLQAPYGRTPGGSALDPGVPGQVIPKTIFGKPNPNYIFAKPRHYVGIDPNDHDQSYLHYGIRENAVKGTPFRDRGDNADTIDYFAPVTHDILVTSSRFGSLGVPVGSS